MRNLSLVCFLAISIFAISITAVELPEEKPELTAVVVVTDKGAGSGNCIAKKGEKRLILTNKHVLKEVNDVWVVKNSKLIRGTIEFINGGEDDIAAFSVPLDIPVAKLASKNPSIGDEVYHFGKTSGKTSGKVIGFVDFLKPNGSTYTEITSDNLSIVGDSGSGVFCRGEFIGLNSGRIGPVDAGLACSVPVLTVKKILSEYLTGWEFR